MSAKTSIEWTDRSWNPTRGCTRVSEGCRNCYAERLASRGFQWARGFAEATPGGPRWTGKVARIPEALDEPLRWRKPQRVFVNSMSDLFHESLPDDAIATVFGVMAAAPDHTFQILTKRPKRMREWFSWVGDTESGEVPWDLTYDLVSDAHAAILDVDGKRPAFDKRRMSAWPLPNVWLGVSVEDQATADERIPLLLQTPAAIRFVSYEPALGPVDFEPYLWDLGGAGVVRPSLDWLIVGGESGPGARPFDLAWARSAVAQCKAAGVPVFVKQLGAQPFEGYLSAKEVIEGERGRPRPADQPLTEEAAIEILANDLETNVPFPRLIHLRDRKGGSMEEWPADLRVREFPQARA